MMLMTYKIINFVASANWINIMS